MAELYWMEWRQCLRRYELTIRELQLWPGHAYALRILSGAHLEPLQLLVVLYHYSQLSLLDQLILST